MLRWRAKLEIADERLDCAVGVHSGNHGQKGGKSQDLIRAAVVTRNKRRYYAYAYASDKSGKNDVEMKRRVHQGKTCGMAYGGNKSAPGEQTARCVVDAAEANSRKAGKESVGEK